MKIYKVNYCNNQSFRAIKLTAEETKLAEKIIQNISGKGNVTSSVQDSNLFNIFYKYLENEAKLKSGKYYIYEEIIAELSLLYSEILREIKENGGVLQTIISKLNGYQPPKNVKKPEYLNTSLDEDVFPSEVKTPQKIDLITEADLPVPESADVQDKHRETLNILVDATPLTPRLRERMKKFMDGKSDTEIAKEEHVSAGAVSLSKKRATLEIQKNNGIIPEEVLKKAKEIKKELEFNLSEDDIVKFLIKYPSMMCFDIDTLKNRFNSALSLFNCNRNIVEKIFISSSNISGTKTEKLQSNIQNLIKILGITEEQTIELGIKVPYILSLNTDKLKDKIFEVASIMNLSYDDIRAAAVKQPAILISTPESLRKKKELRFYYNRLINNKNNNLSVYGIYTTSYNRMYESALSYILIGKKIQLYKMDKHDERLVNYIKSLNKNNIYEYNIPKGESAFDLINYAEKLSGKLLGKNIFKFNIVSDFETQKKQLAELFGLSDKKIADFTKENPFILYHPVQTVENHVQEFAKSLKITKDKALKTALKDTDILVYPAEVIKEKILDAAEKLGGADKELLDKLLEKNPKFYKSKFDKLFKKKALREYYYKLIHKKYYEKGAVYLLNERPESYLYNGILAYIITGKRGMFIGEKIPPYYKKEMSLVEIIKSMKEPLYEYNIPEGKIVKEFIQYAENLSIKIHGKNIFKFNVIKEGN